MHVRATRIRARHAWAPTIHIHERECDWPPHLVSHQGRDTLVPYCKDSFGRDPWNPKLRRMRHRSGYSSATRQGTTRRCACSPILSAIHAGRFLCVTRAGNCRPPCRLAQVCVGCLANRAAPSPPPGLSSYSLPGVETKPPHGGFLKLQTSVVKSCTSAGPGITRATSTS